MVIRLEPVDHVLPSGLQVLQQGVRMGRVISCGPGRRLASGAVAPLDVCPGDRVAFLAALMQTKQGYQLGDVMRDLYQQEMGLIRASDVLVVLDDETRVTV